MTWREDKNPLTEKAPEHQKAALTKTTSSFTNKIIKPKIKSLRDIIGFERYKKMWEYYDPIVDNKSKYEYPGKEVIRLLEIYGKIATGEASVSQVEFAFGLISKRIKKILKFYEPDINARWGKGYYLDENFIVKSKNEKEYPLDNSVLSEHKEILKAVKLLEMLLEESKSVKTKSDKIIFIDKFINIAHLHGTYIFVRLWDSEADIFENDVKKYLDYLREA